MGWIRRILYTAFFLISSFVYAIGDNSVSVLVNMLQPANTPEKKSNRYYCNPLDVPMADPYVLFYEGTYYLYGTYDPSPDKGFLVWVSKDLIHWIKKGYAFKKTVDTWSQCHFWGPEVIYIKGEFYMYFNASPNKNKKDWPPNVRLCIGKSKSPLGPFVEIKTPFYSPKPPDEAIDQNVFIDEDNQAYLYFTRVTLGRNEIQVVKLKDNMVEFDGEPIQCVRPTEPWESYPWGNHVVTEGAYVLKHKEYYYLLYTANHFKDVNYSMGYAVSKTPLGPWSKFERNPILKKTNDIHGTGNGMIIPSPDGLEYFLVYHVHNSIDKVLPRKLAIDRIHFIPHEGEPDIIVIDGPTHTPQPLPSGV